MHYGCLYSPAHKDFFPTDGSNTVKEDSWTVIQREIDKQTNVNSRWEGDLGEGGGQRSQKLLLPVPPHLKNDKVHCTLHHGILSQCNQLATTQCHYQLSTYLSTAVCP